MKNIRKSNALLFTASLFLAIPLHAAETQIIGGPEPLPMEEEAPPPKAVRPKPTPKPAAEAKPVVAPKPAPEEKTEAPKPAPAPETPAPAPTPAPKPATEEKPAPKSAATPKDFTLLKLNGQDIKQSEAEDIWKNLFPTAAPDFNTFDESVRLNVLRGMVSERLLYQEAVKEGINKSDEVKKRLAILEKQVVLKVYLEKKSAQLVTEQQLKDAYAKKVAGVKDQEEVKARHILVATEDEAKEIAKQLKKGADFETLAKQKSSDKASAIQGGDLDYFTRDRMVPEFSDAAFALKKGEVSAPVKSKFGWHIIKVEDRRKVHIPSFEEVKDELVTELSTINMQEHIEALLKKADIKYYSPDGKEREFPRTLEKK